MCKEKKKTSETAITRNRFLSKTKTQPGAAEGADRDTYGGGKTSRLSTNESAWGQKEKEDKHKETLRKKKTRCLRKAKKRKKRKGAKQREMIGEEKGVETER